VTPKLFAREGERWKNWGIWVL